MAKTMPKTFNIKPIKKLTEADNKTHQTQQNR